MAVRLLCVLASAAVLLALPAGAGAAKPKGSGVLWATVNVCDTASAPNTIGIRGSMPGSGKRATRMFMRFQVQYRNAKGAWKPATSLDTGFLPLGTGKGVGARESGHSFTIRPSSSGAASERYILRGLVTFQWRGAGGQVIRTSRRLTTAGHRSKVADPPRYSAAVCNMIVP